VAIFAIASAYYKHGLRVAKNTYLLDKMHASRRNGMNEQVKMG